MGDVTVDSSICLQSGIVQNKLMWKWLKLSNIQQCWDNEVMLHKTLMRLIIPVKFFCGHFMASDPGVWNLLQYCMIMIWMVRFYVDSVLRFLHSSHTPLQLTIVFTSSPQNAWGYGFQIYKPEANPLLLCSWSTPKQTWMTTMVEVSIYIVMFISHLYSYIPSL